MGKMSLSIYMKGDYEEFHALKATKKQSQSVRNKLPDRFISVQCSAFSGQHQDEEKEFEKTKPI